MLKKIKYYVFSGLCLILSFGLLCACSSDDEEQDKEGGDENNASGFVVKDIFEGYTRDGNKVTTVYGTVEFEDYTDISVLNSDVTVTSVAFDSSISEILSATGQEEINDTFISEVCEGTDITNADEFNLYVKGLMNSLNVYNAAFSELSSKFTMTDYNEQYAKELIASYKEEDTIYLKQMGFESIEDYCSYVGIDVSLIESNYEEVAKEQIKNRIINLVILKEQGIEYTDATKQDTVDQILFQTKITGGLDVSAQVDLADPEWQMSIVNSMVLNWLADSVTVVDDMELEAAVVNQVEGPQTGDTIATITVKDYGVIKIRLFGELAPKAVENFVTHAQDGYYDGLTFHRVIDNFMIQGGDPKGDGTGGESIWGEPFEDEFSIQLAPVRGALCMANAGDDTNGSQFFIVQSGDTYDRYAKNWLELGLPEALVNYYMENGGSPHLYKEHTVFGQVFEGMDVIDEIALTETDANDKPTTDVIIEKIEISTY